VAEEVLDCQEVGVINTGVGYFRILYTLDFLGGKLEGNATNMKTDVDVEVILKEILVNMMGM
jgi:hypothetical protein